MSDNPLETPDDGIYSAAEAWAAKRKPADLCTELFVRVVQLATFVQLIARKVGLDDLGNPLPALEESATRPAEPTSDNFTDPLK